MCLCGMVVVCVCYASCVWGDGGFYLCDMHGVWWLCVFVCVCVSCAWCVVVVSV